MHVIAPGYFLTWHTYGTWLHGDDAGSVDDEHNTFGTPRLESDPSRFARARGMLTDPPLTLTATQRILVDKVMRDHCTLRGWKLLALSVRSNHVHVVIGEPMIEPEVIVKQLKDWGTRRLRSHRIVGIKQRVWAEHASTIYLYEAGSVVEKVEYVLTMQDRPPPGHGREDWEEKYGLR